MSWYGGGCGAGGGGGGGSGDGACSDVIGGATVMAKQTAKPKQTPFGHSLPEHVLVWDSRMQACKHGSCLCDPFP